MNRSELVENIAEATSQTKKDVDNVLDQMMESIKSAVARGDDVKLPGFGSFKRTERKARTGREVHGRRRLQVRRELRSLAVLARQAFSDRETSRERW